MGFLKGMASSSRPTKFQWMPHAQEHVGVINWNTWVIAKERTWNLESPGVGRPGRSVEDWRRLGSKYIIHTRRKFSATNKSHLSIMCLTDPAML